MSELQTWFWWVVSKPFNNKRSHLLCVRSVFLGRWRMEEEPKGEKVLYVDVLNLCSDDDETCKGAWQVSLWYPPQPRCIYGSPDNVSMWLPQSTNCTSQSCDSLLTMFNCTSQVVDLVRYDIRTVGGLWKRVESFISDAAGTGSVQICSRQGQLYEWLFKAGSLSVAHKWFYRTKQTSASFRELFSDQVYCRLNIYSCSHSQRWIRTKAWVEYSALVS